MIIAPIGIFVLGILTGIIVVRYGIRVGSRLTIAAQNNEPLDEKPIPYILQEHTT